MRSPFVQAQPSSLWPLQLLSMPSHVSSLGPIMPTHSVDHAPFSQVWVPGWHGGIMLPSHSRVSASSTFPSQSLSLPSQSSASGVHGVCGAAEPAPDVPAIGAGVELDDPASGCALAPPVPAPWPASRGKDAFAIDTVPASAAFWPGWFASRPLWGMAVPAFALFPEALLATDVAVAPAARFSRLSRALVHRSRICEWLAQRHAYASVPYRVVGTTSFTSHDEHQRQAKCRCGQHGESLNRGFRKRHFRPCILCLEKCRDRHLCVVPSLSGDISRWFTKLRILVGTFGAQPREAALRTVLLVLQRVGDDEGGGFAGGVEAG